MITRVSFFIIIERVNVSHKLPYQVALLLFLLNFTTKSYVRINFIRIYSNMSVWVLSIIHDYRYNKTKVKKHYKQRWHCNWDWSGKNLTRISNEPGHPNDTQNRGRNSWSTKQKQITTLRKNEFYKNIFKYECLSLVNNSRLSL